MADLSTSDAYSPAEVAIRVRDVGVAKVRRDRLGVFVLAVLAGAYIALGSVLFTVVVTGSTLGFGATRLLGGIAFSLGLILVVIAGAELFTGNNLIAMAWASRLITFRNVLQNWAIVYVGNLLGALATVTLVVVGRVHEFDSGGVGKTLHAIATHKLGLGLLQAFALGVLCNGLVCLAVWLSLAARSVTDKVFAIVLPIAAFVAVGFEHSIANMVFLPWDLVVNGAADRPSVEAVLASIAVVTLGNVVGGTLLVAGVYWSVYLRRPNEERVPTHATSSTRRE